MNVWSWLEAIVTVCVIALSFYLTISELEQPFAKTARKPNRWWILVYGAIPFLTWMCYFLTYFPGKMTYDSFWQWDMAHGIKPYNNWHPILHTWLIQASTLIYNSPASYVSLQIIAVSCVVAYALFVLQRLGMPMPMVMFLDFVYAWNPVNGFYVITMWKDIPFATAILLLTVLFAKITQTEGLWLHRKRNLIILAIVSFLAMALRDNGPEVVVAALVVFILLFRAARSRMLLVSIPVVALYFIFNGPVLNYFHVIKNPLNQALAIPSQQIAATYQHNGKFTPALSAYFDSILPAKNWAKDYNPYTVDPIKHDPAYHSEVIQASFSKYLENWARLLALNPGTFIEAYLNQVAEIWQFHTAQGMDPYFDTGSELQQYPLGLKMMAPTQSETEPVNSMMKQAYRAYVKEMQTTFPGSAVPSYQQYRASAFRAVGPLQTKSKQPAWKPFFDKLYSGVTNTWKNYFTKGALPLFVLLLSLIASIRRFKSRGIIVFAPVLFVIITIAMAMPATDFRYCFSFVFSIPFLVFYGKLSPSTQSGGANETK